VTQEDDKKKLKLFTKDEDSSSSQNSSPSSDKGAANSETGVNDANIGRTFGGRYKVESKIGRGGMGHVYLAEQIGLGRKVVVKVLIHDPEAESSNSSERFVREAQTLSKLNHPNIVGVHDFGRGAEESYIVMEYVDGYRLDTLIKRSGQIDLDTFVVIARQMLDAVGEAHEQGIVHRDLKPSNIMLTTRKGMPYYVKVLDFGLAKLLEDDSELTGKHSLVGSLSYLAPEQILGEETDQRVDIYALGVLFYYMLAGRKPFLGRDTRVLYQHIHEDAEPLQEVLPEHHGIPDEMIALVHRCLSKDANERPADANALLALLLEIFDPSFLGAMQNPADFSGPSFSGLHTVQGREASEGSNDSRNIIRGHHSTGQGPAILADGSSPSHSNASFSSPSNRALIIEDESIDEESLPLLEVNVSEGRSNGSVVKIAAGAILFLLLGVVGAVAISSMNNGNGGDDAVGKAGGTDAVVDASDAKKNVEDSASKATEDDPKETAPVVAATENAKYKISSGDVVATVTLDGKEIGQTPVEFELSPGSHDVTLSADGYQVIERKLEAKAGGDKEIALAMLALADEQPPETEKKPAATKKTVAKRPNKKKTEKRDPPAEKEVAAKSSPAEKEKEKAAAKKNPPVKEVKSFDDGVKLLDDGSNSKKKKGGEYELLDIQ